MTLEELQKAVDEITDGNTKIEIGERIAFYLKVDDSYSINHPYMFVKNLPGALYSYCQCIIDNKYVNFPANWKERAQKRMAKLREDYPGGALSS